MPTFAIPNGAVAQMVEQWTENPCVAGSTPASTTLGPLFLSGLFCFYFWDTAVSRTEDASGAAGGCPQSVESAVLRAFENASRTPGALFCRRMRRVPHMRPFLRTESPRKRIAYHRSLFCALNIPSVPETPVFYTECF